MGSTCLMESFVKSRKELTSSNHHSVQWMDYWLRAFTIDVFGCDETQIVSGGEAMRDAVQPLEASPTVRTSGTSLDYALSHDEFLESLLYEQSVARTSNEDERELWASESSCGMNGSLTSADSFDSDPLMDCSSSEASSQRGNRKRQRRRSSPSRDFVGSATSTLSANGNNIQPSFDRSQTVNLDSLVQTQHDPSYYLHPQCRMQKDKGRGEEVGSIVCANGADQCLFKLRAKMRILTEYVSPAPGESKKGNATMKRRHARISLQYDNFTETRSLIELRMGFLSMTYGVLLRWDTKKSGKISLVVLRKNCHESFYPKHIISNQTSTPNRHVVDDDTDEALALRIIGPISSNDIKPPYLIPRPDICDPMILSVLIRSVTGLSRKSKWLAQVSYQDTVADVQMRYDSVSRCFIPKAMHPFKVELPETKRDIAKIKIFQLIRRRRDPTRLVQTVEIPISDLHVESTKSPRPLRCTLQCNTKPPVSLQIEILITSEYFSWKQMELEERKQKKLNSSEQPRKAQVPSPLPITRSPISKLEVNEAEDDSTNHWQWVCCLC